MARYKTGVSEDLERIVAKALRKDVKLRYQHIDDFLADLRNLSSSAKSGGRSNDRKMVAVLPFENLGAADDEYFADGITEEITSRLAVVSGLGVISRTSAMRYKGTQKSIAEIGQELHVDYILEGTVRWARGKDGASRVRITPQLIHVSDDTHLWAERYDREIDDIFEVQSDIAEKVIEQLNITLLQTEKEAIQARPTDNVKAYDFYLKGKEHYNSPNYTKKDFETAASFFEKAVKIQPDFALAHVFLGRCHSALFFQGHDRSEKRMTLARQAIDKALKINSELPEAHLAIGEIYYHHKWDLDRALEQVDRAAETIPHQANELRMAILRRKGLVADALQLILKAQESNPGDPRTTLEVGITYGLMQNYEMARKWMEQSISQNPESLNAHAQLMILEFGRGDIQGAIDQLGMIPKRLNTFELVEIFYVHLYSKNYSAALAFLEAYPGEVESSAFEYMPIDTYRGVIYFLLNETDKSKLYLNKAKIHFESEMTGRSEDFRVHIGLSLTLALLGEYGKAIEHGQTALKLFPVYKDTIVGPVIEYQFTQVMTLAGRNDDALDIIERVVGRRLYHTLPFFTLDPLLEPLANHPRMIELKKQYSYQYPKED